MAITNGPLSGIRVLDMSHSLAGPFGTMILSDLGAEIIKLESQKGDMMRLGLTELEVDPMFFYMLTLNRNKKSLVLDIGAEYGKNAFYDLVKISDVVFSNAHSGLSERQGTDYETLKKINPNIIRSNISGYGETGPYANQPAFDIIACGHSGILSISGESGSHPVIPGGIRMGDLLSGIYSVMSVLAALYKKGKSGKGAKVETSLLDSLLFMQKVIFQSYFSTKEVPSLQGRRHHLFPTYGVFNTKDGYITLCPIKHDKLIDLVGLGWMYKDPKFENIIQIITNKDEFIKHFEDAMLQKTTNEWLKILRDENDIASGPALDYDQVASDPQVLHNNMIKEMELKGKKYRTIASVFNMPGIIEGEPEPPPDLGQHTKEILKDLLGYSDDIISKIIEENRAESEEWMLL